MSAGLVGHAPSGDHLGSITAAQASVAVAAACPTSGTISITAEATRHGAATTPQPVNRSAISTIIRMAVLRSCFAGSKLSGRRLVHEDHGMPVDHTGWTQRAVPPLAALRRQQLVLDGFEETGEAYRLP
jgi:hypothetical protein